MCINCDLNGLGQGVAGINVDFVYVAPDGTVFPAFFEGTDGPTMMIEATGQTPESIINAFGTLLEGFEPPPAEPEAAFMSEAQAAEFVASQPAGTVFIDASSSEWTDISSEAYRTYIYPEGVEYSVVGPLLISISESGDRIFDDRGDSHWIHPGYVSITWRAKPGKPNFK